MPTSPTSPTSPSATLVDRHAATLAAALEALRTRGYHSAFPESPSPRVYGEAAGPAGLAAFQAWRDTDFPIDTPGAGGRVATERSPYGPVLGIRYPHLPPEEPGIDEVMGALRRGLPAWRDAGPLVRAGVALEILARLHARIFELAHAVMHTSGQAFVMAFQAGGAHALDRALEAVASAYEEQVRVPAGAYWEKPAARGEPLRMLKTFRLVPRGVSLVIGCSTFPTWNSWPGLFASLVTGNPVLVKPHPAAVLPLAITVQACREVLGEAGFDADLACLAVEEPGDRLAAALAVRPEVRIIDYTGSSAFGTWLEAHARQAAVFTEKSGVNSVVIDSTDSFDGMCANLAFSLSLYSGQMCTTPQNLYVPRQGIATDLGHRTLAEVGTGVAGAIEVLLADEARAVELLGAVVDDGVLRRLEAAASQGGVVLATRALRHPAWPEAVVRTPALVAVDAEDEAVYGRECFGPVSYLVATDSTAHSLELLRRTGSEHGAMTASVYSTSPDVVRAAERAAVDAGVGLSINLTGGVYVNQSAAFSDFHGSGANPAATAAFTDPAYVAARFHVVQSRRHTTGPPA